MRYRVFRFTHVPPKRRVTTTSGSINAPIPIVALCKSVAPSGGRER
jgi:hypothetical protein